MTTNETLSNCSVIASGVVSASNKLMTAIRKLESYKTANAEARSLSAAIRAALYTDKKTGVWLYGEAFETLGYKKSQITLALMQGLNSSIVRHNGENLEYVIVKEEKIKRYDKDGLPLMQRDLNKKRFVQVYEMDSKGKPKTRIVEHTIKSWTVPTILYVLAQDKAIRELEASLAPVVTATEPADVVEAVGA